MKVTNVAYFKKRVAVSFDKVFIKLLGKLSAADIIFHLRFSGLHLTLYPTALSIKLGKECYATKIKNSLPVLRQNLFFINN